jgi:hypothetical protein
MMKFYKEGARRILAGPKKMSTILITAWKSVRNWLGAKMLTAKQMPENAYWTSVSGSPVCGKAEEGSG